MHQFKIENALTAKNGVTKQKQRNPRREIKRKEEKNKYFGTYLIVLLISYLPFLNFYSEKWRTIWRG